MAPTKDLFGNASDIDGDTIVIGACFKDGPEGNKLGNYGNHAIVGARLAAGIKGRAFLYERQEANWVESAVLLAHNVNSKGWSLSNAIEFTVAP